MSFAPIIASSGVNLPHFLESISGFLGGYYILLAVMNAIMALYLWQRKGDSGSAIFWSLIGGVYVVLAAFAMSGDHHFMPKLPESIRHAVNVATGPTIYTVGTTTLLLVLFVFRKFFVQPM